MAFNNIELTNLLEQWKELGKLSRLLLAREITTDSIESLLSLPDWFELGDKELMVQLNRIKVIWHDTLIDLKLEHDIFLKDTLFRNINSSFDISEIDWKAIYEGLHKNNFFKMTLYVHTFDNLLNSIKTEIYVFSIDSLSSCINSLFAKFNLAEPDKQYRINAKFDISESK
jgi:hypothetical protein